MVRVVACATHAATGADRRAAAATSSRGASINDARPARIRVRKLLVARIRSTTSGPARA